MMRLIRFSLVLSIALSAHALGQRAEVDVVVVNFDALSDAERSVVCTNLIEHGVQVHLALQQNVAWRAATEAKLGELVAAVAEAERALESPGPSMVPVLIEVGAVSAQIIAILMGLSPAGLLAVGGTIVVVQIGSLIYFGSTSEIQTAAPALSLASSATLVGFGVAFPGARSLFNMLSLVQIGLLDSFAIRTVVDRAATAERLARHREALVDAEAALPTEEARSAYMIALLEEIRTVLDGPCSPYVSGLPVQLR